MLKLKVLLSCITATTVRVGLDGGYMVFFSPRDVMGFSIIEKDASWLKLVILITRYIDVVQRVLGKCKRRIELILPRFILNSFNIYRQSCSIKRVFFFVSTGPNRSYDLCSTVTSKDLWDKFRCNGVLWRNENERWKGVKEISLLLYIAMFSDCLSLGVWL